jgi:leucyl aminopeptidase
MFLYQFAKDAGCPYVHLDIAPRMTAVEADHLAKGSPGDPVRFLLKIVEEWRA